jgi:large subunit ribosomal protein L25
MALTLHYEKRDQKSAPRTLRKSGKLPAVFYGRRRAATPITVSAKEFEKVWRKAGENTVVGLQGGSDEVQALIHEVDKHPVTGAVRHADFYVFEKGQKLTIKVPIEFTGIAPAVKDLGGVLVKVMHNLEIEAEPKDLPRSIAVDISSLATFESVITAREVALPAGVSLVTSPSEVIASVYEPKEEVVEAAPVDLSQIAVVEKGKKPTEGESTAEGAGAAKSDTKKEEGKKDEKKEEKKAEKK